MSSLADFASCSRRRPPAQPTCSTTYAGSPVSGSPYPTSCTGAAAANTRSTATGTVLNKAALTITASSHTVTYGEAAPTVTPSFAGFVLTDNAGNSLSTQPTCSTTYAAGSPVSGSPYPTSCTGAAAANYEISTVTGTVTVNKAALTITASSHTVTYGEAAPAIGAPSFAGFVLTDNAGNSLSTQPTCSTTYAAGSPVSGSPYPTSCTGAAAANYEIQLRDRHGDGQQGGADHHGVEPHGDLRRGGADGDAQLRRLRAH